jgi:immunity protein, SdpI family
MIMSPNSINPIFINLIIVGPVLTLAGFIVLYFPPKKINWLYGYRTFSSMKSQERWDFAQKYSARQLIKWSLILIAVAPSGLLFDFGRDLESVIAYLLIIVVAIIPIYRTEKALKREFGK